MSSSMHRIKAIDYWLVFQRVYQPHGTDLLFRANNSGAVVKADLMDDKQTLEKHP